MQELLTTIANPETGQPALAQAIRALGAAGEPPQFWTAIADSERYTLDHRRRAIVALFERHLRPPVRLGDLARTLDGAPWLRDEDVEFVRALGGKVPVTFDFENTVVALRLFSQTPADARGGWAIYLRIEGLIEFDAFIRVIRGRGGDDAVMAARVLEVGLPPVDGEWRTLGKP